MFDGRELKESLTIDDIAELLALLGAHSQEVDDGKLVAETICHNGPGEGSSKLYYYDNTKLFNCYSLCGYYDIFDLIISIKERDFGIEMTKDDAVDFVLNFKGFSFIGGDNETGTVSKRIEENKEYKKPTISTYNDKDFKSLRDSIIPSWKAEGISEDVQREFQVKKSSITQSILFPHRDKSGSLVGIRQRNTLPEAIERFGKYRPATLQGTQYTSPLSFYLFGLDRNLDLIRKRKQAVVFEGEKSVMLLESLIGKENNNSVASFGMNFSIHQFKELEEEGVEEIIIAFDKQYQKASQDDIGFQKLTQKFTRIAERYTTKNTIFSFVVDTEDLLDYKDAPIDKGIRTFNKLLENRITLDIKLEKDEVKDENSTFGEEYSFNG